MIWDSGQCSIMVLWAGRLKIRLKLPSEMQRLGMELGPFVLYADFAVTSFVLNKPEIREMLVTK